MKGLIIVFLFILAISFLPPLSQAEVVVEGLYSMDRERFLKLMNIEDDRLPEAEELTVGLKRLFLTGLFDDIRIEKSDGVIKINVRERELIERIKVRGNFYIHKDDIINAFLLKESEPMRYDLLDDAKKRLKEYLSERGFPGAEIVVELKKKKSRVRIIIHVREGAPELVKKIYGPPHLIPFIRLSEGEPFDRLFLERDINFIKEYYRKEGFIKPEVKTSFHEGILRFEVEPGQQLRIKFNGNRYFSEKELLRLIPFEVEEVTDEFVEEASHRIISAYRDAGFPFAEVRGHIIPEESKTLISIQFDIKEGARYRIGDIHLAGDTLPEERLLEIIGLKKGDYYNPDLLKAGIERLRGLYESLGYKDIVIDEPSIDFNELMRTVSIGISIKEGQRIWLDKIVMRGNWAIDETDLKKAAGLYEGMPYNEIDINDARLRIIELYAGRGYPEAECEVSVEVHDGRATVVFTIAEGKRYLFGHTIIRGNLDTSQRVIERELPYKEGDDFRQGYLMEVSQRLYRLGLFSDVEIEAVKEDGKQDVLITVKEAPAGSVEFGIGYGEYERYRGFFDISYRNLFGMNRQVSFRTEVSSLEQRYILNYYDPRLSDSKVSLKVTPFYEERREKNIDTGETLYRLRRYAEKTGIETPVGKNLKIELYHEFSLVKTYDILPEVVLPREDTGTLAMSSIIPGLIYDSRDNPFDPRKGFLTGGRLKIASSAFGSEQDFFKLTVDASTYISLSKRFVLAMGVKGGAAWPFGKTEEIPIVERFFLGGRSSVRGFSQDTLGPQINGTPVGGNYFVQTNVELRWYPGRSFSFVTFLDGGNVWLKDEAISIGDLRYSVGIGIRYNTPAGPIRLDYGQKIDRQPGESRGEVHFSIGHAF